MAYSYSDWLNSPNKCDIEFYDNDGFRKDYAYFEMSWNANMFQVRVRDDVLAVLRNIWRSSNRNEIRVLSLGCGPGSDLLGILTAVDWVLQDRRGWQPRQLESHCTGVDAFRWEQDDFRRHMEALQAYGDLGRIYYEFVLKDMETFVHDNSQINGLIADKFDFICLSFADAGRNLELVGKVLPQLLSEFGRVLVLDTDSPEVASLADFGYECSFRYNGICLYSRGRCRRKSCVPYRPSPFSPIATYRLQQFSDWLSRQVDRLR